MDNNLQQSFIKYVEDKNAKKEKIDLYDKEISFIMNRDLKIVQLDNWKNEKNDEYNDKILKYHCHYNVILYHIHSQKQ